MNEAGDQFSAALAVGDFDGDGIEDLAVGTPRDALGADPKSGSMFAIPAGDIAFILR